MVKKAKSFLGCVMKDITRRMRLSTDEDTSETLGPVIVQRKHIGRLEEGVWRRKPKTI